MIPHLLETSGPVPVNTGGESVALSNAAFIDTNVFILYSSLPIQPEMHLLRVSIIFFVLNYKYSHVILITFNQNTIQSAECCGRGSIL